LKETNLIKQTGDLYSELFDELSDVDYSLLSSRFWQRIEIEEGWLKGKICLDAGVGSGRAVTSMSTTEAELILGIDIGEKNIRNTIRRTKDQDNVHIMKASVLKLPFHNASFDFIYCSGVLHHTPSPEAAFRELVSALKKGGLVSIGVYGKGGLMNTLISLVRLIIRPIPFRWTKAMLSFLPLSNITKADILDYIYVPIQKRHTEKEVLNWFTKMRLSGIKRIKIEKYDYTLLINRLLWGEGWIQMQGYKAG
jgi:ubiquinone/menaquinone biosynthesis C-methylase UbiE